MLCGEWQTWADGLPSMSLLCFMAPCKITCFDRDEEAPATEARSNILFTLYIAVATMFVAAAPAFMSLKGPDTNARHKRPSNTNHQRQTQVGR